MRVYLDLMFLINFLVDFFLLAGTNRLCGFPTSWKRCAVAAVVGGIYGAGCLLPGFAFLGNTFWRTVFLGLMGFFAFGGNGHGLQRTVVFVLLSMALGGAAMGMGGSGFGTLAAAAVGICLMCVLGFREGIGQRLYVPVQLRYGDRNLKLLALRDTGNTLRDPVSGERVMVLGDDAASRLTGLTKEQLAAPVETLSSGCIPGLRLIPYRSVGQGNGMLLALRLDQVIVDGRDEKTLVAFAPEGLGGKGTYQALVGGMA